MVWLCVSHKFLYVLFSVQFISVQSLSHVQLFATTWTAAYQAPVHGISQARVLEWGAIAFSKESDMT